MAQVKQARVLRKLITLGLLCAALIWWLGDRPGQAPDAVAWGVGLAVPGALLHWRWLARRIAELRMFKFHRRASTDISKAIGTTLYSVPRIVTRR